MAQFLVVKNFEKFQHYKDRNPPWIKFHYATLSDYEITSLSDAAQGQLFKFWLLASRYDNLIPYDLKWLKRELKANGPVHLKELLASGLLAIREQGASAVLGLARADAPSQEAEGEREVEKETESSSAAPRFRDAESEGVRLLLDVLGPTQRRAMSASLNVMAQGYDLPNDAPKRAPTAAEFDRACRELAASVPAGEISARVVGGYIARVMRGDPERPTRNGLGTKPRSAIEIVKAQHAAKAAGGQS